MALFRIKDAARTLADKNLHRWLPGYLRSKVSQVTSPREEPRHRHLLFAFCDHYEPLWRRPGQAIGEARVRAWHQGYPALARGFRDADGRHPRHSFFFPGEEYSPSFLDPLTDLVEQGVGEVELHLHHDGDTPETLRASLEESLRLLGNHGHFAREGQRYRYAFIHGNWCLANARRDGRWCGVDAELPILFQTGCYADFTFPAAPNESQPGIVNQIYWPEGDLARARCYEQGRRARVGHRYDDRILIVEGPLAVARRPDRLLPRIETSAITAHDPPTPDRIRTWVRQNIHVEGRPEWVFVKVHTHGAPEAQGAALLGAAGRMLHTTLTREYNDRVTWSLHYVTAREMFNVALAAMAGKAGDPAQHFDFAIPPPPAALAGSPARPAGVEAVSPPA